MPNPTAGPFTATTTGFGNAITAFTKSLCEKYTTYVNNTTFAVIIVITA